MDELKPGHARRRRYSDKDLLRDARTQAEVEETAMERKRKSAPGFGAGATYETFRLSVPARAPIPPAKRKPKG